MKKKMVITLLVLTLILIASAYRFGIKVTSEAYSNALSENKTMLAFNHMKRYEELLECLKNKKTSEAAEKLRMSIINEKELIAEFLTEKESKSINEYISIRYKEPIENLKNYKSNRGKSWIEPSCK